MWSLIEYANKARGKSSYPLRRSSIAISQTTHAVEGMSIRYSTGERGRDSFPRSATHIKLRLENALRTTWTLMNADKIITFTKWEIFA